MQTLEFAMTFHMLYELIKIRLLFLLLSWQRSKDVINQTKAALEADKKSFGKLLPIHPPNLPCSLFFISMLPTNLIPAFYKFYNYSFH